MQPSRNLSPRSLLFFGAVLAALVACENGMGTAPRRVPDLPTRIISASDTDSVTAGACAAYDIGHCDFYPVTRTDLDWMNQAVDETTCPWMQSYLNKAMLHGWIHVTDETANVGKSVYAMSHWPTGSIGSTSARMHLDVNNAFVSYAELSHTMRHEAAHIYGYGRGDGNDAQADDVATACGG